MLHDSEIDALLELDWGRCDFLTITHPVRLYDANPMTGSRVEPFPPAAAEIETVAARIASRRARCGIKAPLIRRARHLYDAGISRDRARADLRAYHAAVVATVARLNRRGLQHGSA